MCYAMKFDGLFPNYENIFSSKIKLLNDGGGFSSDHDFTCSPCSKDNYPVSMLSQYIVLLI